ncbi:MAG: SUMF1/EgtB/PvdO family nonheme iron enzyme [Alphaproteobacteria bacterium]|nr:SUMF1/EgtB/PvdO family nonheme iron enzyme [Alphaproteobacteria bacterium]
MNLPSDLADTLRSPDAVLLVGPSLLHHLTGDARLTPAGLLNAGLDQLDHLDPEERDDWRRMLARGRLTAVGDLLRDQLVPGEMKRWLRETFEPLTPPAALSALAQLDVLIATVTPDGLLARALGLPAVPWTKTSEVERLLRGQARGVLHLHGHWSEPDSLLLGRADLARLHHDPAADALLKALRTTHTFVLVGFDDALSDGALRRLLAWSGQLFAGSETRHYRLVRADRVEALRAEHSEGQRFVVLPYGEREEELLPLLQRLAPVRDPVLIDSSADEAALLARYAEALRAEAEQLSRVFCPDGRRELSEVYVRLRVRPTGAVDQRLPPEAPLRDYLRREHRLWVVLGGPGSGKTTLLRQRARELLDEGGPVPLLLKVSEVCDAGLWRAAAARYGPDVAALLERRAAQGALVLLLDGLDEALDLPRARLQVTRIAATLSPCRVVVSSRVADYDYLPGDFRDLELLPLDPDRQAELLSRYCTDPGLVDRVLRRLRSRHRMRDLAETPLLLSLVGVLLGQGAGIPEKRADLYATAIGLMLDPHPLDSDRPRLTDVALARRALGAVSLALHDCKRDAYPLNAVRKALQGSAAGRVFGGVEAMLRDIQRVSGLVEVHGEPGSARPSLVFPHRTFREFFAAEALVAQMDALEVLEREAPTLEAKAAFSTASRVVSELPGDLPRILQGSRERPEAWSEVLALACGLLDGEHADRLVAWVAAEGHGALVARVVAEGEGLSPETVRTALGLEGGWYNWETRRDLLLELPETIGDLDVVVGLIDTFAQGTTDGNDLFWARELLRRVARGEVAGTVAEGTVADVRERAGALAEEVLWRHRPREQKALQRELEERGLWKTIPAGEYVVGSPVDEEGRYDDEGPQHPVTLTRSLRMLAVPVTWAMYERFDPGHREARSSLNGPPADQTHHPVNYVTWYAAVAFAEWLGARLPLEAEWEIACRAETSTRYWSGDTEADLATVGWYDENSGNRTHPVATPPTKRGAEHPWGLFDMHGNVWEWCLDPWVRHYRGRETGVTLDPNVPRMTVQGQDWPEEPADLAALRVVRGGCWVNTARLARSAFRSGRVPGGRSGFLGFRLVLSVAPEP